MMTFFMSLAGFGILAYALLLLCGAVMGDAGLFVAAILVIGIFAALIVCVLEKLSAVEKKVDRLLEGQSVSERADDGE